jgi:hypothetical protein
MPTRTLNLHRWILGFALLVAVAPARAVPAAIPLPEHPRPDFERRQWVNLNGAWEFKFDGHNAGLGAGWFRNETAFPLHITVPFGWGSKLSGVGNEADIAWYRRTVRIPESWRGQRVFLVVGASDWLTRGWLDGRPIGEHQGGYTPFEFELTHEVTWGADQSLVLRVDDAPRPFKLEGKQGYGNVRGLWQTAYLEARPPVHVRSLHFIPDVGGGKVTVRLRLSDPPPAGTKVRLVFRNGGVAETTRAADAVETTFDVAMPHPHLWSLEDPFLYEVDALLQAGGAEDRVSSYFGMREIGVTMLPGTSTPYVALNGKPIYLQLTLDQSYHPDGFYTFPTDAFMRDEILRSKQLGLNGNRVHIKVEVPRKLYWADRLGLLIMADVPNSWGEPDEPARQESEAALRGMIERDFNHPAIFCWVTFNETWGLFTGQGEAKRYLPETQQWVASMYRLARQLDPTRLVEDNSPCNRDHVETDLNSWHDYLPGYAWRQRLDEITANTHPGSPWNFIGGRVQASQPMFNSECGNVWGYDGSTGDVDWSWDYHIMLNEFRRHPQVAGWLYTEHHDVINEWNGYYRFDRSPKFTGLEAFVPGMTLRDLHAPFYLSTGSELCRDVEPGAQVTVPVFASLLSATAPSPQLVLRTRLYGWDDLGEPHEYAKAERNVEFRPWRAQELEPLAVTMPNEAGLAVLALTLESAGGEVLHRNFTTFLVHGGPAARSETRTRGGVEQRVLRFAPASFTTAKWSRKQWQVLDGLKVNGAGAGYFEYEVAWPKDVPLERVAEVRLILEASAKPLLAKDRGDQTKPDADYMRGEGIGDGSANPNAYPMTDTKLHPSAVRVSVNGQLAEVVPLPDDPADHRGVLSWHAQLRDKKLREAGSYGYLVRVRVPPAAAAAAAQAGRFVVRFEVAAPEAGGLAIYGERFGRYPLDPTLVLTLR